MSALDTSNLALRAAFLLCERRRFYAFAARLANRSAFPSPLEEEGGSRNETGEGWGSSSAGSHILRHR
jgi:hypothetical protein